MGGPHCVGVLYGARKFCFVKTRGCSARILPAATTHLLPEVSFLKVFPLLTSFRFALPLLHRVGVLRIILKVIFAVGV